MCSSGSYLVPDAYGDPGVLNICGENLVPTVLSPTSRVLTGSTLSIADLYRTSGRNRILLGQYRMPFQVTVQE